MVLLKTLLEKRGIKGKKEQENFLRPDYDRDTYDPFLLGDMEIAVNRILQAIKDGERIAIYSDYDMDGIPGAVVLNDFFSAVSYANFTHHIPDRNTDGFGLNDEAVRQLARDGVKLIITVDCGIRAVSQVAEANKLGVDVIVTDHHIPADVLPDAVAVVNPNKAGDAYNNKDLCGAGVAYKLVQALVRKILNTKYKIPAPIPEGLEKWSLDMVAMATVSDMVSLVGENRALTHFGLRVLRKSARPGIRALCQIIRMKQEYLTEDDIMFSIAPRINAASRMGHAGDALMLLTSANLETAQMQATELEKLNKERKSAVITMVKHIKKTVTAQIAEQPVLVVGDPRWQPGLLGLAATRAVELYGRPACVWGRGDSSLIKGSCRSDGTVNIVSLLESASDVLVDFGGHEHSGGFSVLTENVHKLAPAFSEYVPVNQNRKKDLHADVVLALTDVNWETYRTIEQLAPFGAGNPKLVFVFESIKINEVRRFGTGSAHIEILFKREDSSIVRAIQFFAGKEIDEQCVVGAVITMHAHLEQSFFGGGTPELRLRIVAIV